MISWSLEFLFPMNAILEGSKTIQTCQLELHQATAVEVEVENLSPKAWQPLCFGCYVCYVQAVCPVIWNSNVAPDMRRRRRQLMPGHNLLMRCNMG